MAKAKVAWDIARTFKIAGRNWISVELSGSSADGCVFNGAPIVNRNQNSRWIWNGNLLLEQGPTLYKEKSGCECEHNAFNYDCYVYKVGYEWSQGITNPGLPGSVPWPFRSWMKTDIELVICADGSALTASKNSGSSREYSASMEMYAESAE